MVPSKSTGSFVVKRVIAFLDEVGCLHNDVIVKSGQLEGLERLEEVGSG